MLPLNGLSAVLTASQQCVCVLIVLQYIVSPSSWSGSKDGGFIWSVEEYCGDRNIIRTLAGNSVAIRMEYSAKGAATKAGERIVKAMGG